MATGDWIELVAHYNGVYVFLSYLVAVVGAWTTLEMLLKRTGSTGSWNIMLLLGAGIAFGSTATFGMHFVRPRLILSLPVSVVDGFLFSQVGNQAVTLRLPAPWEGNSVPLSYNAGYTILSLVVSCLSMIIAFSFIGLRIGAPSWRARLTDEEHASTHSSAKSHSNEEDHFDDEPIDSTDAKHSSPSGGAFDPDLKVDSQHTRFALPGGRKMSLAGTAFNVNLPKRGKTAEKEMKEKRNEDDEEEEEERSEDGGDFGVHAASVSAWGVAKVLIAGIVCGGGIAAMRAFPPSSLFP
jgi:hypothetical protein